MALTEHPEARPESARGMVRLLALMVVIEALSGVTQGYLNPILPALGDPFDIDAPTINGIFLISNISFAVMTPLISRLGDSYGYRRVLRVSTALVAIGALMMAFVPTLVTVIVGVVMLTCVVGFIPLMMGVVRVTSPAHTRLSVSWLIGTLMVTVGVGGLAAGLLGASDPVRGFWVGVPVAVAAVLCAVLLPGTDTPTRQPWAFGPLACCSLGLIGLTTGLSMGTDWGWLDPRTLVCGLVGAGLLVTWVRLDTRRGESVSRFIDLGILRLPSVRSVSIATFFFGFSSVSYFGTNGLFLHADAAVTGYGFGFSPLAIAVLLAAASVLSLVTSVSTTPLMARFSERFTLVLAALLLAGGFVVMILGHRMLLGYVLGFCLFNLAMGMYQAATRALSVEGVPVEETSAAAGINELALSLGIAIGAAVIKLVSSTTVTPAGDISHAGIVTIWLVLVAGAVLAGVAGARYPRLRSV